MLTRKILVSFRLQTLPRVYAISPAYAPAPVNRPELRLLC